jgi:hypothetical protein
MSSLRPSRLTDTRPEPSSRARIDPVPELSQLGRAARLLDDAQRSLERAEHETAKRNHELSSRIHDLEENLGEMEELLARTERQAAQLANLFVATYQLHASLEVADVRAAIADIAVNLLGAERFSILLEDETGAFVVAPEGGGQGLGDAKDAIGAEAAPPTYTGGDPVLDACLKQGTPQFGPAAGSEMLVAVPFVRQGEVVGVLSIRAFLSHKPGLNADDHELLDLMAAHAASALVAARAFHVSHRKLTAYEGLLGFLRGGPT